MDQESVVLELDPRSVLSAIKEANQAVEGWEKGTVGAGDRMQKALERQAEMLVRLNDRSRSSMERLTSSIEKQAAAYGKSGVERLVAERDRWIKKLGDEQAMVDRVRSAYDRMIAVEKGLSSGGGIKQLGAEATESRAALALMGEEMGVHIPRHIRGFIAALPGVGQALNSAFNAVAVVAVIGVIVEAIRKLAELHEALERMHTAAERASAEFLRFNDSQKLANAELALTNTKLENAIAKLEHKPENKLKEAIEEAEAAAQRLSERLDKSLRSFMELVQKNAPGTFASIVGGQAGTSDIQELIAGKSGFGGMIGEVYKVTSGGGNPTDVLERYRASVAGMIRQSEFAQAYQQGKGFEGVSYEEIRGAMTGGGKLPAGLHFENMLADQSPRLETLRALDQQIALLVQSYNLEKQNSNLQGKHGVVETAASNREMEQGFIKRMTEVEMGPVAKIFADRDDLVRKGANPGNINDAALAGAAKELHKEWLEDEKRNAEMQLKAAESAAKQWDEVYKTLNDGSKRVIADFKEEVKKAQEEARKRDEVQVSTIRSAASNRARIIGAAGMPGDELATLRDQLAARLGGAQQEYALKQSHSWLYDMEKERLTLEQEMQNAGLEYEAKVLELRKAGFEATAKTSAGLWNTLLTKPGEFPKQLGGTIHSAILKPITDGLGNMSARVLDPIIHGSDGQGGIAGVFRGIFGGPKQDPLKAATDLNTSATAQNSAALAALTAVLAGGMGMAVPAIGAPAGIPGGISVPGISVPAIGGKGFSLPSIFGGGFSSNWGGGAVPLAAGPGGATVNYGWDVGGGGGRGIAYSGPTHAASGVVGQAPGQSGFSLANLKGSLGNLENFVINPKIWDATGTSFGAYAGSVLTSPAAMMAGMMLGTSGLVGSNRGTWAGIGMGTAGGALVGAGIGAQFGGPVGALLGAGIGGAAGALVGLGEKIAGVETPENQAKRLIKQIYSLDINDQTAKQIAAMAKQSYGGQVSVAVRSPEVRQLLQLYAESTGQKSMLFLNNPQGVNLAQANNTLQQSAVYNNGTPYTYASNLSVLGPAGTTIPTYNPFAGGVTVSVSPEETTNLWATGVAAGIAGSPRQVAASAVNGGLASSARVAGAIMQLAPDQVPF